MDSTRLLIGLIARAVTWLGVALIVGDAVVNLFQDGRAALGVAAAILFPVTFFVWPWTHHAFGVSLIIVFVVTVIAYPISTFVGRLPPID